MPSIQSLKDPSTRTWVTGETYTPRKQNADDQTLQDGVEDLNSAIVDLEKNYASSSQPLAKVQGKEWYDSGNSILKLYHMTNGTPVGLLDTSNAYNQSLSTGGTATLKPMGTINVNTTQEVGGGDGILMSYDIPANTLDADGKAFSVVAFGINDGEAAQSWNVGTAFNMSIGSGSGYWFIKGICIRSSSTNRKRCAYSKSNRDDPSELNFVDSESATTNWGSALTSRIDTATGTGTTQEIMITKLLP